MERDLQGYYVTISTVDEKVRVFVPDSLSPYPPVNWTPELRSKFDHALLALGYLALMGVVKEFTKKKRNGLFCYNEHIDIMNQGTELPE